MVIMYFIAVIIQENELGYQCSNLGWGYLHFAKKEKKQELISLPPTIYW